MGFVVAAWSLFLYRQAKIDPLAAGHKIYLDKERNVIICLPGVAKNISDSPLLGNFKRPSRYQKFAVFGVYAGLPSTDKASSMVIVTTKLDTAGYITAILLSGASRLNR